MTTSARITDPEVSKSGKNPLKGLLDFGQSPWMDYIRRDLLTGGELKKLIHDDGLRGMTSNPSIFAKAISSSKDYSDILESPEAKKLNATQLYEKIAVRDVQDAADIFRPVYDESRHRDGYVSLEVSPTLALEMQKDSRRSAPPLENGESPQRDDQSAGHERMHPGDSATSGRRHQYQHHAALRAVRLRKGCRGIHCRAGSPGRQEPGHRAHRQRGQFLRQPHRYLGGQPDRRKS